MRTLGKKAGIITYLLDTFKAVFAALAVHFLFGRNSDIEMLLFLYSGFGVVLGHNFPVYLKFKGGKGIAATSGVALSLLLFPKHCWVFAVFGLITFASVTLISKYVSLGSLVLIFSVRCGRMASAYRQCKTGSIRYFNLPYGAGLH